MDEIVSYPYEHATGTRPVIYYHTSSALGAPSTFFLSNLHKSPFWDPEAKQVFLNVEQYYRYQQALVIQRLKAEINPSLKQQSTHYTLPDLILKTSSCKVMQNLIDQYPREGDYRREYKKQRAKWLVDGTWLKFSQNNNEQEALLRTGTRILAELVSGKQGTGYMTKEESNKHVHNGQWLRANLAGRATMEARHNLIELTRNGKRRLRLPEDMPRDLRVEIKFRNGCSRPPNNFKTKLPPDAFVPAVLGKEDVHYNPWTPKNAKTEQESEPETLMEAAGKKRKRVHRSKDTPARKPRRGEAKVAVEESDDDEERFASIEKQSSTNMPRRARSISSVSSPSVDGIDEAVEEGDNGEGGEGDEEEIKKEGEAVEEEQSEDEEGGDGKAGEEKEEGEEDEDIESGGEDGVYEEDKRTTLARNVDAEIHALITGDSKTVGAMTRAMAKRAHNLSNASKIAMYEGLWPIIEAMSPDP